MTYKFRGTTTDYTEGATRWSLAGGQFGMFYYQSNDNVTAASLNSLTDWLGGYEPYTGDTTKTIRALGYGKDASGNPIYIASQTTTTANEIAVSSTDVTSTNTWTMVNLTGSSNSKVQIFDVVWGADSGGAAAGTWMAVGEQSSGQHVYRSRDGGASWSSIAVPSGDSGEDVHTIASNGSGTWAFVHDDGFYLSTNDGASFTKSTPFTNERGLGIGYNKSNNTWIAIYVNNSGIRMRTCSGTDFTTWSSETLITGTAGELGDVGQNQHYVRAYNGRVMIVPRRSASQQSIIAICDVNGTSISNLETIQIITGNSEYIHVGYTDGSTWLLGGRTGDVFRSTDNAETWTQISHSINVAGINSLFGNSNMGGIVGDVYLPL